jgi:hypothetical protein
VRFKIVFFPFETYHGRYYNVKGAECQMAVLRRKKPQQTKSAGTPSQAKVRMAGTVAAILLVTLLSVFAVMKYAGNAGITGAPSGPSAAGPGPAGSAAEGPRGGSAAAITSAVITPPNPSSRTPLSAAFEASNPGGGPLAATFRWYVDGNLVQDGPSNALQPGPYRKGASVYAEVAFADQNGGGNTVMTPAVVITNGPPEVTMVNLDPENAVVGAIVSATPSGTDPDGDPITYTYQWRVNGNPVGAPGGERTFSTEGLRKNDIISATVTYSDGTAGGVPVGSNSVRLLNRGPKIISSAPLDMTTGLYVYQVTAKDPDGDALTYRLDRFPAGMAIDGSSGLIRWEPEKGQMFTGRNEVAVSVTVDDRDGGTDSQEFTIIITDLYVN